MLPLNQSYESAVRGYPQTVTVLGGSLARTPIEAEIRSYTEPDKKSKKIIFQKSIYYI
jgi:hypothetical protein